MALFSELTSHKKYAILTIVIVVILVAVVSKNNPLKPLPYTALGEAAAIDSNSVALYKPHPRVPPVTNLSQSLSRADTTLNSAKPRPSIVPRVSSEHHSQSLVPLMGNYSCQDSVCSELLSKKEKERYIECARKANTETTTPAKCHFINSTGRAAVALTSFPGSGNTWIRGLLEKATDVCTGNSEWERFLQEKGKKWLSHFNSWTQNQLDIQVLHVQYENIQKDAVREVKRMLKFLGVPYSEEELRERLSEDFDLFHRSKHVDFDPYTPKQRQYVNQQIRKAVEAMKMSKNEELDISSYLRSAL